jgi:hypothetical protein
LLSSSFRLELNSNCLDKPILSDKIEVDCDNCLPVINVSLPNINTLTSTNLISITGSVSSLKPSQSYNYYFSGNSNWPIVLENISGSFIAKTSSENIVSRLIFCSPSGNCSNNNGLLPYTLSSKVEKALNNNLLTGKLQLNIQSSGCDNRIFSSNISNISCNNCLPNIKYPNILFSGSPTITLNSECCSGQKLIRVNVSNAIASDKYIYQFTSLNSAGVNNIVFNPSSGEIYFGSGGTGSINTIAAIDLVDHAQTLLNVELNHVDSDSKTSDTVVLVCNNSAC